MKKSIITISLIFLALIAYGQETTVYRGGVNSTLTLTTIENTNAIQFEYLYASETRIRELEGVAAITEEGVATYTEPVTGCEVTFNIDNNKVTVSVSSSCNSEECLYMAGNFIIKKEDPIAKKWYGQWKNSRNGLEVSISESMKDGHFSFRFISLEGCEQSFDFGEANILQDDFAVFKIDGGCNITFQLKSNGDIKIDGTNCDHGFLCAGFDGEEYVLQ